MSKYFIKLYSKAIVTKWWGQKWCKNISEYADYENRLERGRAYLRSGAVQNLVVENGKVTAFVSGSSDTPYEVTIKIKPLTKEKKDEALRNLQNINDFQQGLVALDKEYLFSMDKNGLFPSVDEIDFSCNCPDYAVMCKHIAAVLYAVGSVLDQEPLVLFQLRGIDVDNYLEISLLEKTNALLSNVYNTNDRTLDESTISDIFGIELGSLSENTVLSEKSSNPTKTFDTARHIEIKPNIFDNVAKPKTTIKKDKTAERQILKELLNAYTDAYSNQENLSQAEKDFILNHWDFSRRTPLEANQSSIKTLHLCCPMGKKFSPSLVDFRYKVKRCKALDNPDECVFSKVFLCDRASVIPKGLKFAVRTCAIRATDEIELKFRVENDNNAFLNNLDVLSAFYVQDNNIVNLHIQTSKREATLFEDQGYSCFFRGFDKLPHVCLWKLKYRKSFKLNNPQNSECKFNKNSILKHDHEYLKPYQGAEWQLKLKPFQIDYQKPFQLFVCFNIQDSMNYVYRILTVIEMDKDNPSCYSLAIKWQGFKKLIQRQDIDFNYEPADDEILSLIDALKKGNADKFKLSIDSNLCVASIKTEHEYLEGEKPKQEELKRQKEAELKRKEETRKRQEQIDKQKATYRMQGLCQHCGGKFKMKFIFLSSNICSRCGKKKDY